MGMYLDIPYNLGGESFTQPERLLVRASPFVLELWTIVHQIIDGNRYLSNTVVSLCPDSKRTELCRLLRWFIRRQESIQLATAPDADTPRSAGIVNSQATHTVPLQQVLQQARSMIGATNLNPPDLAGLCGGSQNLV